jgi:hypothetical protein
MVEIGIPDHYDTGSMSRSSDCEIALGGQIRESWATFNQESVAINRQRIQVQ